MYTIIQHNIVKIILELLYYDSYCNYIVYDIILIHSRFQILYIDNNKF